DPMAGSGTIGDVARALGRRAVSFDLVSRRPHILRADARAWPVPAETAALAVIDSPYSDDVAYSTDPRCLGRISCRYARFYDEMGDMEVEAVSEWNGMTSREIVGALRERVRAAAHRRHDRVVEHAGRQWISWRSRRADRVFAEIRPLRGRVQVFILPGLRELS